MLSNSLSLKFSYVWRFLYNSLNAWVISGVILLKVKEIMSAFSSNMGTINPTKIIQALSSYFQHFSQLENLKGSFCGFGCDCLFAGWMLLFYAVIQMHHFVLNTEDKYRRQCLGKISNPCCFSIHIGGQTFATLGIVSEQCSHIAFL